MAKKLIWIDQQEPRPRQDDLAPIYSLTHTFSKWLLIIRLIIMIISSSTTTTVHLEIPHLFVGFTNWPAVDEDPTIPCRRDLLVFIPEQMSYWTMTMTTTWID